MSNAASWCLACMQAGIAKSLLQNLSLGAHAGKAAEAVENDGPAIRGSWILLGALSSQEASAPSWTFLKVIAQAFFSNSLA